EGYENPRNDHDDVGDLEAEEIRPIRRNAKSTTELNTYQNRNLKNLRIRKGKGSIANLRVMKPK
ncbi:hypothetical protein AKJ43_02930, partial [candidate division MSBL1 archaeon SCGC-AAA261D19]